MIEDEAAPFATIIEPFKIKSVEPIRMSSPAERAGFLAKADYNLFKLASSEVIIDLLTDSGTAAMSSEQWAGMMRGDEAYAGSASYARFESAVRELTGFAHIIPVHQGRAAERILFTLIVSPGKVVVGNRHFDTTRANIEALGGLAIDLPCLEASDSQAAAPFKGNIDLVKLEALLKEQAQDVPACVMTITDNAGGGQPVSLANLQGAFEICHRFGVAVYLDAARFAENAMFCKLREAECAALTPIQIAKALFACADGCLMSAKKDGIVNMGGFLALNDEALAAKASQQLILTEGFTTYGGMAGRDLEAIAQGLHEVVDESYLRYRLRSAEYLGRGFREAGIPIVEPPGGHAIYVDARGFLDHIAPAELPGQALCCAFYLEGGIRSVEVGTVMFGHTDPTTGAQVPGDKDLVRFALPRRVYTQSHVDYVIEVAQRVAGNKRAIPGYRIAWESEALRHFTAKFQPLESPVTA